MTNATKNQDADINSRQVPTPTGITINLMDVYSRDQLAGFLNNMSAYKVAKQADVSFPMVKRLQAKGGSVGYKSASLKKLSDYVNDLLAPLSVEHDNL
jgi:hypothetical protein